MENRNASDYELLPDGRFRIREYALKKPFSNFLPGIAGLLGVPMWAFYVNRGQGLASFGTRNKDNAILEFFPANKAYQMVTSIGFRTFIKFKPAGASPEKFTFQEPFSGHGAPSSGPDMLISSHEFSIRQSEHGIETEVTYFTVPGEPVAALARRVTVTNRGAHSLDFELLDGLPQITPYGMNEFFVKQMSRTIEAWMKVENLEKKAPFFRLKVDATDRPEVTFIEGGNFYAAFSARAPLEVLVDSAAVFGPALDFSAPVPFEQKTAFRPAKQIIENKTPCAFASASFRLAPGKSRTLDSFIGHAPNLAAWNRIVARFRRAGYWEAKREENRLLIESIKGRIFSATASNVFDHYAGQTYLDNVLRGGLPCCLGDAEKPLVFYPYSRKHGDLERDYNRFLVEDTPFSQGDGNYRDVNQNRRSDVLFEPRVGESNVRSFLNLIQLDGFNPLVVRGTLFHCRHSEKAAKALSAAIGPKKAALLRHFLKQPFTLGTLWKWAESSGIAGTIFFKRLLGALTPFLSREDRAEHGEGFWTDHWTYNLDLIESYLSVFPENLRRLLLEDKSYSFYENAHRVRPRDEKFFYLDGRGVRQYKSVFHDEEKAERLAKRSHEPNAVRTRYGKGSVYRTTLLSKLLCLYANKLASLDPAGTGIEMEADKPSWYDALNGLPGLAGSSLPESFELKRLSVFIIQCLDALDAERLEEIALPAEVHEFVRKLDRLLADFVQHGRRADPLHFWNLSAALKEEFRRKTADGLSGHEKKISLSSLKGFLERGREKIETGLDRAWDPKSGLFPTYFENEVLRYRKLSGGRVRPLSFRQKALPFFLESSVHALKVEKDPARRRALVQAVRRSPLYDAKLGMYKVNAPLQSASLEIGRATVFTPGWLENESVWLHMEYKFLLEMLRAGLHEDFFRDAQKCLIPFQPAERYGRSLLENSSFIVSSAFPDASLHGTGFVARLSGSTAEFIQMWSWMSAGRKPFILGPDEKVSLRLEPYLPEYLFTTRESVRTFSDANGREQKLKLPKNSAAFLFLGKTLLVYHNPRRLDTFGHSRVSIKRITVHDRNRALEFRGDTVPSPYSLRIRDERVPRIDVELG